MVEIDGERAFVYHVPPDALRRAIDGRSAFTYYPGGGGAARSAQRPDRFGVTTPRATVTAGSEVTGRSRGATATRGGTSDGAGVARTPVAVPAGADAGEEDGQGSDLLAGDHRLHEHQRDADPARPLRHSGSSGSGGRLQHRLAARRDPPHPAHAGPAQHRPRRRGAPRPGDRLELRSSPSTASTSRRCSTPTRTRSAAASAASPSPPTRSSRSSSATRTSSSACSRCRPCGRSSRTPNRSTPISRCRSTSAGLAAKATTIINAQDYGRTIYDMALRRDLILIGEDMVNVAFDAPWTLPPRADRGCRAPAVRTRRVRPL